MAATVPMPSTNKELAELIRDVVGARPKYGDESARPAYWPVDVPWQKGKSISQVSQTIFLLVNSSTGVKRTQTVQHQFERVPHPSLFSGRGCCYCVVVVDVEERAAVPTV